MAITVQQWRNTTGSNTAELIDSTIATIENCFDQPGYEMYCNLEGSLIESAKQQVSLQNLK